MKQKQALLIVLGLFWFAGVAKAQNLRPAGFLNHYQYNETNGASTGIGYVYPSIAPNGVFFGTPYNSLKLHSIGNNYNYFSKAEDSLKNIVSTGIVGRDTLFVAESEKIILYHKNKKLKTFQLPRGWLFHSNPPSIPGLFLMRKNNGICLARIKYACLDIKNLEHLGYLQEDRVFIFKIENENFLVLLKEDRMLVHKIKNDLNIMLLASIQIQPTHSLFLAKKGPFFKIYTDRQTLQFDSASGATKILGKGVFTGLGDDYWYRIENNMITASSEIKNLYRFTFEGVNIAGPVFLTGEPALLLADDVSGNGSTYVSTTNQLVRIFPYIRQYPRVFNGTHSVGAFVFNQDSRNRIWVGSYGGTMSIIDKNQVTQLPYKNLRFLSGSMTINKRLFFYREFAPIGQLLAFDEHGGYEVFKDNWLGFYMFKSKRTPKVYFGGYNHSGLLIADSNNFKGPNPRLEKIDSTNGLRMGNTLNITEDSLGRLWLGGGGLTIYNPSIQKAKTWLFEKREIGFRFLSSFTDAWGTVWMGTFDKGLHYYNDYSKEPAPQSIRQLSHPLLNDDNIITSLTQWGKWLIIGKEKKLLLLDLNEWHDHKKILLRYLNPQEGNFSAPVEQNVFLTDRRDSSLWFSTSDNIYQLDLKKWLSIPTYKVSPNLVIHSKKSDSTFTGGKSYALSPRDNTFTLKIWFQTKDNMPRYMSTSFVNEGDSIQYSSASLQTDFMFSNLASGHYTFYLKIFQSDGTTTAHSYSIEIKKFLWEEWWFWAIISCIVFATTTYFLNIRRRKQLAEKESRTRQAELHSYRAEQEKKMTDLKLSSLSSQFRPHFILNALNTIGARMDNNPEPESVISRLGESVNLIFNHAQQNDFMHEFETEWKLVENVIHIHRLMYLKELEIKLPEARALQKIGATKVPLGLVQIPVENALLHGLSNRLGSPWMLQIEIQDNADYFNVHITDNGVGRKKASDLSNFTRHGTGLKNLNEILAIINKNNHSKMSIWFDDGIFTDASGTVFGTTTMIQIPKKLNYFS